MSYFNVSKINYEGPNSTNPFSFKQYNENEIIGEKKMSEHLKFAMSYWHTFNAMGTDQFGEDTMKRHWDSDVDIVERSINRVKASFEFMEKLSIKYFCFHDVDLIPETGSLQENQNLLEIIVSEIEKEMKRTGIKLLWGTTNAFSNQRFVHGAATSCNADVFAYTAAKIKNALDITNRLNGEGYVFWGGREGYDTLLNTNMSLELDNLATMLELSANYAKKINFSGGLFIEPKPMEPTKHQYDFDASTVIGFLKKYNLDQEFKLNLEVNHATLAGHSIHHELVVARENKMLGSVDINYGDVLLGWDTDQFPTNIYDAVYIMHEILLNGGLECGGLNFDAKVRRASFNDDDLFLSYIAGMDNLAWGLKVAHKLIEDNVLSDFVKKRYESYERGIGKDILEKNTTLEELALYAKKELPIINDSGRQEYLESIVNQYIYNCK
ncbi:MAG: xylose isomerase [Mycoplasmatales bacterium]